MKKTVSPRLAFTLIELLVVISIIAVLAGMTFTGVQHAMEAAKKVQAKNDMMQIANAITSYYTEYGKYPSGSTTAATADTTFGFGTNNNSLIINVLRCVSTGTTENTRQIKFIEPKVLDASKGCVNRTSGIWFDPWGTQYLIFEDLDYDDAITVKNTFSDLTDNPSFGVGTASVGLYYAKSGQVKTIAGTDLPQTTSVMGKKSLLLSWQ